MSNTVARNSTPADGSARITVSLPADARLYVDDVPFNSTSGTRAFNTPKLEAGRDYTYTLKAEIVRNGQTRSDSRRVVFQAGKEINVDFRDLETSTATASR
jgi:uncharacterized protein (TIGR03000 family)